MSVGADLFEFALPTRIVFGTGALERLAKLPIPGKKTLLVTTSGGSLVRSGLLDRVKALFAARGVEIVLFDRVFPNPTDTLVMEASALARSEGVDFVTGLGGGSALDVAKAIAMTAVNEGDVWDYVRGGTGGGKSPAHPSLPTLLIPTTAGTGSEADPWIVLGKLETGEKIAFGNRGTYPTMSVVDPALTLSVPPFLTACQGFDALCHAAEGYLNRRASPVLRSFFALAASCGCLGTVRLLAQSTGVRKGDDLAARSDVSLAATLAGVNESLAGCISLHALEHALSAKNPNLTHGQGLAMLAFRLLPPPYQQGRRTRALRRSCPVRSASRERRHPPISLRCYTTFSLPAVLRTSHGGRRAFRRKTSRTSSTMPEAPWAHSSGATRRNSRTKISSKSSSAPGGTERSAVPPKNDEPRPFRTGVVFVSEDCVIRIRRREPRRPCTVLQGTSSIRATRAQP